MNNKLITTTIFTFLCLSFMGGCGRTTTEPDSPIPETSTIESSPSDTETVKKYDNPVVGIQFDIPNIWNDYLKESNNLELSGYECALDIRYTTPLGMELMQQLENPPENQTREELDNLNSIAVEQVLPVLCIIAEYEGSPDPEVFRFGYADEKPLGEFNGTKYTLLYNKTPDLTFVDEESRVIYQSVLDEIDKVEESLVLSGHKALSSALSFNSITIDGQVIDSSVFEDYDLTAINIWATWCTPCTEELPELQKVYEGLPENVNFLGICTDAGDEQELASKMVAQLGVTYQNIIPNKEMEQEFLAYITSLPTTVFVDSQGNFVGNSMIGVPYEDVADTYLYTIDKRLSLALKEGGTIE